MLELVPGLLDGEVFEFDPAPDPVVPAEPDIAVFSCTFPLASLQCVAADTLGEVEAPGVADGGEPV